jgi:hypothetical protein
MDTEQQILHTTMRVEGVDANGNGFFATAFVYERPIDDKTIFRALVSNKHVLMTDAKCLKVTALRRDMNGDPAYGKSVTFDLRCPVCGKYHIGGHPNPEVDVAAIGIAHHLDTNPIFYRSIGPTNFLDNQPEDRGLQKGTLETVLFVGYPNGIYDVHNVLPIARFGRLATMMDFDYLGKPQFLIDAAVFGGSSGSPVFVYRKFRRISEKGISFGEEPHFVGVLAAVHQKAERGQLVPAKLEVEITKELGLGLVFKQDTVTVAIEDAFTQANNHA